MGSFTQYNGFIKPDTGKYGVVTYGSFWDPKDPGIGIILQYKDDSTARDFSRVTSITYSVRVENPAVNGAGVMAYVQNGAELGWAGDYHFWNKADINDVNTFQTFTYVIDRTVPKLDLTRIVSFRIKANGSGLSSAGKPIVHILKVVMQ